MKNKTSHAVASLSAVAAVALSGSATAAGPIPEGTGFGPTKSPVGKIQPINLIHGSTGFAVTADSPKCCGPYEQCKCPDFKGAE